MRIVPLVPALAGALAVSGCGHPSDPCTDAACETDTPGETDTPTPSHTGDTGASGDTDTDPLPLASCDDLGIATLVADPADADPDGTLVLSGRFPATPGLLDSACAPGATGGEVVVSFTAPADGTWLATTDAPGTLSPTLLSLRTACDDRAEVTCDAHGDGPLGARVFLDGLTAGQTVDLVVDSVGTHPRGWQLVLRPVDGIAAVGDACDDATPCVGGATCTPGDTGATCVAFDTPTITGHTFAWADGSTVRHTLKGTDADGDVTAVWLTGALGEHGEVYGDDPEEIPFPVPEATVVSVGGTFTVTVDQWERSLPWIPSPMIEASLVVEDRTGRRSAASTVAFGEPPDRVEVGEGEACDVGGFPRLCTWGFTCAPDGLGAAACAPPSAPVLDGVTTQEIADDPGAGWFTLTGTDVDHDIAWMQLEIRFADDWVQVQGRAYFVDTTWAGDHYTTTRGLTLDEGHGAPVDVTVTVFDDQGLASDPLTVPWAPAPVTPVPEGAACAHLSLATCEAGLVCSPTPTATSFTCEQPAPPVLYGAELVFDPQWGWYRLQVDGADPNGDVTNVDLSFTWPDARFPYGFYFRTLSPSIEDVPFFVASGVLEEIPVESFLSVTVSLRDATGNRSAPYVLPIQQVLAPGEACDPSSAAGICDPALGLSCGPGLTCEPDVAPTITTLTVHRTSDRDVRLDLEGADPNADAFDAWVRTSDVAMPQDLGYVGVEPGILGQATFATSIFLPNVATQDDAPTLEVALRDRPGAIGPVRTVVVPPIVGVGEACSGDDTVDRCQDGSSCTEGLCARHAPELDDVEVTFVDHGRTALVTLTGRDPDLDLTAAIVVVGGGTAEPLYRSIDLGMPWAPEHTLTWAGETFTITVPLRSWGGADTADLDLVEAFVSDAAGLESDSVTASIVPTRQLGETCDAAGADDRCQAGLACDAGTCEVDGADACAGVPVVDLDATGVPLPSGGVSRSYDLSGGTSLDLPTCAYAWTAATGPELAFRWTAPHDGHVQVSTTRIPGQGLGVFAYVDQCVDPGGWVDCGQDGETAELDVVTGDVVYVLVDTFWGAQPGSNDLVVDYLP